MNLGHNIHARWNKHDNLLQTVSNVWLGLILLALNLSLDTEDMGSDWLIAIQD